MMGRASLVVAGLTIGACTVGPDYHRPALDTPADYRGVERSAGKPVAGLGDLAWWEVFRDPVLQELLREARTDNADSRVAAARVDLVRAQVAALRASQAPQVDAAVNETVERISPIGLPQNRTGADPAGSATILQGEASWEIDFWGKYRRGNEAGRASLLAGQAAQRAVATSLVAAVASAYFNLLALDEQLKIAETSLTAQRAAERLTLARMDGGVDSQIDLRNAQARAAGLQARLLHVREVRENQENALCMLLGRSPQTVPRGMTLAQEAVPEVGPGIPSSLLERRPDVLQAEQQLIAANADIGVAKAAYFPNIGLTAGGGRESTALHNLFTADAATWMLQPSFNVPIFTGGRIHAQLRQAEAERTVRLNVYVASVHRALRDVADALAYRARAVAAERDQETATRDAGDVAGLSAQRVRAGLADQLESLSADENRLQAEYDLATARFQRLDATVQLYGALGGGWRD